MTTLFEQPVTAVGATGFVLRPYQQSAGVDAVLEKFLSFQSVLMTAPTGTGKTVICAHIIRHMPIGMRTLVIVQRDRLAKQWAETVKKVCACDVDIEFGASCADEHGAYRAPVVVAGVQKLNAGKLQRHLERFRPSLFGLVIIDEAHHARAETYERIVTHFQQNDAIKILGCTATPKRLDKKALRKIFKSFVVVYEHGEAIRAGWLVPIREGGAVVHGLDLSHIKTVAGDFNKAQLGDVVEAEKVELKMMSTTIQAVGNRQTLVFAVRVTHAIKLCEILNRYRPGMADFIHGATSPDDRDRIFHAFESHRIQFLVNVDVIREGVDLPGIQCIVICRPTKSWTCMVQMIGRGTRVLPGIVDGLPDAESRRSAIAASTKPFLEVLNFTGNAGRHKLITPVDILGGRYDDDVIAQTKRRIAEKPGTDILSELETTVAKIQAREMAEQKRRRYVVPRALYSIESFNPFDLLDIKPAKELPWHRGRPLSPKMIGFLRMRGVDLTKVTYTDALQIIGEMKAHPENLPPTRGQAKTLRQFDLDPKEFNEVSASECIDKLAQNGWKR